MKRLSCVLAAWLALFFAPRATAALIHHWEFEEDFADSASDADGTPLGAADFTADAKVGDWALVLNGAGDSVEVLDRDSLRFTAAESYTVAAWIKAASGTSGFRGVVTKGRDVPPWYGIWIDPANLWLFGISGSNALTGAPVEFDRWTHVTIVQDGAAGTREIYVDGLLEGTEIARDSFNFGNLIFGGAASVDEWFTGEIDDVRVYDEALGALQIAGLASGQEVIAERTLDVSVSAAECPPSGRGPVTVHISQPLAAGADPAEEVTVVEHLTGPVTAAALEVSNGGAAVEVLPDPPAPVGVFADHRNVVTTPVCPGGNGDTVDGPGGVYTQTNVGEDIWQGGDTFQFAYNRVSGDFDVTVRVVERIPAVGSRWGKFGIMARQDLSNRSRYTYTHDSVGDVDLVTGRAHNDDDSTRHARRATHGGDDNYETTPFPSNPSGDDIDDYCDGIGPDDGTCEVVHHAYLRLVRQGSLFSSFSRADPAEDWTRLASHDWGFGAPGEVLVGLATTSHTTDCGSMISIDFDEVDYGGAEIVPLALEPLGVDITWSVTREQLAAGIEYTVDVAQGDLSMSGTVDGAVIFGTGGVSLHCDTQVISSSCATNASGGADLTWENHAFADPAVDIEIGVNGEVAATVAGDATSATVPADALAPGLNTVCILNSSGVPVCCDLFVGRPGPIHRWELEGDFDDSVSNADGTPVANADITGDARIGAGALAVGGGGDFVEVLDRDSLRFSPDESYTVTAWVKPASLGFGWTGVVTKGRDAPPWFGIWISPFHQWAYGTDASNALVGSPAVEGEWTHVAIVQNGPFGTRELYVNGALDGAEIARDAVSTGNLLFGGAAGVDEWFTGVIDDVRVYDVPLTAELIAQIASGEEPSEPEFVRGDADSRGGINLTDGIVILNYLFLGAKAPACLDAADTDDDGTLSITDSIKIFSWLFLGGSVPGPPSPSTGIYPASDCGPDPSQDDLTCEGIAPPCEGG